MCKQFNGYAIWLYEEIDELKKDKLYLVRHKQTGDLALKRYIRSELVLVYRALMEVVNKNLPRIFELFEVDGSFVVLEEYIQGNTLQALLESGTVHTHKQIKDYGIQLCDALRAVHDKGVVHRDIKLSNVILTADGIIKLIDFDAARLYNRNADKDTEYIGTHGYAAPEQYGFAQSDARSDIFAVGVLLGKLWGENGSWLGNVIRRCTNLDPNKRYKSAQHLKNALIRCRQFNRKSIWAIAASLVIITAVIIAFAVDRKATLPVSEQFNPIQAEKRATKRISAGLGFTVAVKNDGIVLATGNNENRQCDVKNWRNIIAVDASYFNTVGLRADGTVTVAGSNYYGQRNTEDWTDIVAVASGGIHTVGLKSDGTVVAVGSNNVGQCEVDQWTNIVDIAADFDSITLGLKSDGTVVVAGDFLERDILEQWTNIIDIEAGACGAIGLKSDGTVVAAHQTDICWGACKLTDWTDIVAVSGAGADIVGLKSDGMMVSTGLNYYGQSDVSHWPGIIEISAGVTHTLGLKSDGTLIAAGANNDGECNIEEWNLFK